MREQRKLPASVTSGWATLSLFLAPVASVHAVVEAEGPSGSPSPRFVPNEIVVKLVPEAGAVAMTAATKGFGPVMGSVVAESLDELLAQHGAEPLRPVFSRLQATTSGPGSKTSKAPAGAPGNSLAARALYCLDHGSGAERLVCTRR